MTTFRTITLQPLTARSTALNACRSGGSIVRLRALRNCSQQIADRYGAAGGMRPLERVLAIPRAAFITQTTERHAHWSLAPQIQLSLSAPVQVEREHSLDRERTLVVRERTHTSSINRLVERLTTRLERVDALRETMIEARTHATPVVQRAESVPPAARGPMGATPRAVARVVKRNANASPVEAPTDVRSSDAPRSADVQRPSTPPPFMRETPSPAINVEQLADRVVRVIDKRLTASRERFGRF